MTRLRNSREDGRYANRVRIVTLQGSAFDGKTGVVARVVNGTPFVRLPSGATLPFGRGELEVVS